MVVQVERDQRIDLAIVQLNRSLCQAIESVQFGGRHHKVKNRITGSLTWVIRLLQNSVRPSGILIGESRDAECILPPLKCFLCSVKPLRLDRPIYMFTPTTFICHRKHGVQYWEKSVRYELRRHNISTIIEDVKVSIDVNGVPTLMDKTAVIEQIIMKIYQMTKDTQQKRQLDRNKKQAANWKRYESNRKSSYNNNR